MVKIIEYKRIYQMQLNTYAVEIQAEVDGFPCDFYFSSENAEKLNDATADFLRGIADILIQ